MFLALLAAAAGVAGAADTTSLAGKWNFHYNIQGYEEELECTLTQDGQNVSGPCKSSEAPDTPLAMTGKVEAKQVTLQYKTTYNGDDLTVVYTGKLETAEKVTGTVDVEPMGASGDFTATAVK